MPDVWVVDASPLITLDQIGCVHLLARLSLEVMVPRGVIAEVSAGPMALTVEKLGPHRAVPVDRPDPRVAAWDLGAGETEVLSWIIGNPGAIAILDDRAARQCASTFGIRARGTIGVLLDAKRAGLLTAVAPLIEKLRSGGLYLSDTVIENALKIAGEGK